MNSNDGRILKSPTKKDGRKVRALYDFEAAEDNELTFFSGEILYVTDDSDSNWWTGYNDRGDGLFPSNFVTADLNADVELTQHEYKADIQVKEQGNRHEPEIIKIDENKIDRLLHLLHEANPEDPSQVLKCSYVTQYYFFCKNTTPNLIIDIQCHEKYVKGWESY